MRFLALTAFFGSLLALASGRLLAGDRAAPATEAEKVLRQALDRGKSEKDAAQRRRLYQHAAEETLRLARNNVLVSRRLKQALAEASKRKDEAQAAAPLGDALQEALGVLTFRPSMEAKQPAGFPELTPVGEIRLKHYPSYRLARAAMKKGQNAAFWTLFQHIEKNHIAMTAPVEMTCSDEDRKDRPQTMAFLYGDQKIGKPGKDGDVEVVNIPAMTTVSLGLRGRPNEELIAEGRQLLHDWLKEHADQYQPSGPMRVLGYNSPFIGEKRSYTAVEIPVKKVEKDRPPQR